MTIKWIDESHYWNLPPDTESELWDECFALLLDSLEPYTKQLTSLGIMEVYRQFDDVITDEPDPYEFFHRSRAKCWHLDHPFYNGDFTQTEPDIIIDGFWDASMQNHQAALYFHRNFVNRKGMGKLADLFLRAQLTTKYGPINVEAFEDVSDWQWYEPFSSFKERQCRENCAHWYSGDCCKYAKNGAANYWT